MEIAIIIAFAIVLLQTIVIYGLGKRYTQAIKQIKELELDLQDHITGSDKDARTITALRRTINEIKTFPNDYPPMEWTQKDESICNSILSDLDQELKQAIIKGYDAVCKEKLDWLQSIRERIRLQINLYTDIKNSQTSNHS